MPGDSMIPTAMSGSGAKTGMVIIPKLIATTPRVLKMVPVEWYEAVPGASCRAAGRNRDAPNARDDRSGFRLCFNLE